VVKFSSHPNTKNPQKFSFVLSLMFFGVLLVSSYFKDKGTSLGLRVINYLRGFIKVFTVINIHWISPLIIPFFGERRLLNPLQIITLLLLPLYNI